MALSRVVKNRLAVKMRQTHLKSIGYCVVCGREKSKVNAKTNKPQLKCDRCSKRYSRYYHDRKKKPMLSDTDPLIQMINEETGFFDAVKVRKEAKVRIDMPIKRLDRYCQFNGVAIIYEGGLWRGIREEKYPEPTIYMSIKK